MQEAKQKKAPTPPCVIFPHGIVEGQVDQHRSEGLTNKEPGAKGSCNLMDLEAREGWSRNKLE